MLRSRFLWKLFGGYVLLTAMTALVVGMLHNRQLALDALAQTKDLLRAHAFMLRELAQPVLRGGKIEASFQEKLKLLGRETGSRFTVILSDGTVLADSDEDPVGMDDHEMRPEVSAARASRQPEIAERRSDTLNQDMVYLALPVQDGPRLLGFARTARARTSVDDRSSGLRTNVALGVLFVGCLVGLAFARRLTHRLRSMTGVAQAMAAGDHQRRVEPMGSDEVGQLARAINTMAEQLEQRLAKSSKDRAEVLAIVQSMVEGVVAVDGDQRVVLINAEARRILDVDETDITGQPIWEVTRIQALLELLDLALAGASKPQSEITLQVRGEERHVSMRSTPLRNEADEVAGAVLVLLDITDIRRLEVVRRDFVTNVSHEIKTPLTSIHGYVETLLDDPNAEAGIRQRFLGKIRDHSQRLSSLVSDLLTLARAESEGQGAERGILDLREPTRESISLLAPRAEDKNLRLHTELPERAVLVQGDGETLRQLCDNLLDNAIKYTPSGGEVWVRLYERNTDAVLEVEDTGVGLDPSHRERVFERFYRVDRARSRELGGTGLGLSIVKHVAQAHRGHASVESSPGEGRTFRVLLPISR